MFNIDIASLRDPNTLDSIKRQLLTACAIVSAYEGGAEDAAESEPFQSSLTDLMRSISGEGLSVAGELHQRLTEAYNLGWDTVRLQRGVVKNAK